MTSKKPLRRLSTVVARLDTGEQVGHRLSDSVADGFAANEVAVNLSDAGGGRWRVAIHFRTAPDEDAFRALVAATAGPAAAKAVTFETVVAQDWVRASLAGLRPVAAGRFLVHGAHDRASVPANRIGIEIDAALAFGTGHHGTTYGCLLALDRLCNSPGRGPGSRRILDLGTGSGVLAIAAARALRRRVLATDIDPNAVRTARANARLNRVGTMVEIVRANGITARCVRERAPFDLVLANILLGPLQRFASPFARVTTAGGRIVLSGLLPSHVNAAIAAYHAFALERRFERGGWTTLVLVRRTRRRRHVARRHRRP